RTAQCRSYTNARYSGVSRFEPYSFNAAYQCVSTWEERPIEIPKDIFVSLTPGNLYTAGQPKRKCVEDCDLAR
ncbi:MAG: hypothetical protein ACW992_07740, partial [Candidatus Thorarchaeota archaeon]